MNKSLVSKLKSSVDNPELLKIGEFKIKCNNNASIVLWHGTFNLAGCYIKTVNGDASLTSETLGVDTPVAFIEIPEGVSNVLQKFKTTAETEVVISQKYDLIQLLCIEANHIDAADLSYTALEAFRSRYQTTTFDVSKLNTSRLVELDLYSTKASIKGLNFPVLEKCFLPQDSSMILTDLISSNLPALVHINNWSGNRFDSVADGASLEKFAEKLLTMYPTKTIQIERGHYIYFHEQTLPNPASTIYKVVANTTYVSVLSGDTEIGRYDGSTWTYNS